MKKLLTVFIILSLMIVLTACGGSSSSDSSSSDSDTATEESQENSEAKGYIKKANAFYTESGAFIKAFSENTSTDNYEENRRNLMTQASELNDRVTAELNQIPEDTTDPGLQLARQALEIDSNICMALYSTLATNDPSGAELITQYVNEYNELMPELQQYTQD